MNSKQNTYDTSIRCKRITHNIMRSTWLLFLYLGMLCVYRSSGFICLFRPAVMFECKWNVWCLRSGRITSGFLRREEIQTNSGTTAPIISHVTTTRSIHDFTRGYDYPNHVWNRALFVFYIHTHNLLNMLIRHYNTKLGRKYIFFVAFYFDHLFNLYPTCTLKYMNSPIMMNTLFFGRYLS